MRTSNSMRWLVVVAGAVMLLAVVAACSSETIEVPGETVVVKEEVIRTVEVPGETVTVEVVKEVQVPGETVVVEKVVTETVEVPGETVVVKEEVVKTVEVPGETVTVEVVKEVQVPGETVVVEKEVVKTVEVPGETVVVEKEVVKTVEVPGETVVVTKEVLKVVEVRQGYVTDPSTGKAVSAPQYGGTLTYAWQGRVSENVDPFAVGWEATWLIDGVNEQLAIGDWGLDRKENDFKTLSTPLFAFTGALAESWETPDDKTFVFNIRDGVRWHNKAPMNGRELTAHDVAYNWNRMLAQGDFTERPLKLTGTAGPTFDLPWQSIEATDKYTVVFKLKEPKLDALALILNGHPTWILPPEVIEQYGNYEDWKNVVGTGPMMLTDYVEGVSKSFTKNPDYWGYDEKYPQNRLPYVDEIRALVMAEEATRISALRTGKVDMLHIAGGSHISTVDVVRSLQKTNPEMEVDSFSFWTFHIFGLNIRNAPFDDIRVRHALQMALDLETINITYFGGFADWEDPRFCGGGKGYYTPFEEWTEELKGYYTYDPEGAEKLLDEAGYPRGADGVRFKTVYDHRDVIDLGYAEIAAGYFAAIGVDVEIDIVDSAAWVSRRAEANYEMITGIMVAGDPAWCMNVHRAERLNQREYLGGVETSVLNAASDAFFAATTVEEQRKAMREWEMDVIKQHNQIWGPQAPQFQVNQPWVIGFNGEVRLGNTRDRPILARLWIDSELKEAMGY